MTSLLISKSLIRFTFKQLINFNIHLGVKKNYWNSLNYGLVLGVRQDLYFLNLNLTLLNLRYSFNLINFLLESNLNVLFYNYNEILTNSIIKNYTSYDLLNMNLGLGNWVNGFLTNFKLFRTYIVTFIQLLVRCLKKKSLKIFLRFNFRQIWNFFLFLRNLKVLPSGIFLFYPNDFAIFESLKLHLFSMALCDVNKNESTYLAVTYLIPFNYLNFYSLLFLLNNVKNLIIFSTIKKKKLFYFLVMSLLKENIKYNILYFNIIYSFLVNLIVLNNKKLNKNYKLNNLLILKLIK